MAVRCLRCGAAVGGLTQLCDQCSNEKRRQDEASAALAAQATMVGCPHCGISVSRAAETCSNCGATFFDRTGHLAGGTLAYGGFWVRLAAALLDGLIMFVPGFVIGLAVTDQYAQLAFSAVAGLVYTVGFWIVEGATPGKMLMNLRVVNADGSPLNPGQAFIRYFGYILNGFTLGVGYLLIVFSDKKQGLHDHIAGTIVVRTEN